MNPLMEKFEFVPFDKIKNENFIEALEAEIGNAKKVVDGIRDLKGTPTFKNVVEALEFSWLKINVVSSTIHNLLSTCYSDEMQEIANKASEMATTFSDEIMLDGDIFKQVEAVYKNRQNFGLNHEQNKLLDNMMRDFVRNGAALNDEDKQKIKEINIELNNLSLKFGENVLNATNKYILEIDDIDRLKGLPFYALESAEELAAKKGKPGKYLFSLQAPSFTPLVTYCDDAGLREEMVKAQGARCFNDEFDNREIIKKVLKLKDQKAKILGYANYAEYQLELRMASTPANVKEFLDKILKASKEFAVRDIRMLEKQKGSPVNRWDVAYYSEKIKKNLYDIDDNLLKPYFELGRVTEGAFKTAGLLYDLEFRENSSIPKYHEDVKIYDVYDVKRNKYMGILYTDFYARETKQGGAWMTEFRDQYRIDGVEVRPHVSIVCNFPRPTAGTPSLLSYNDVLTLFHEFGHALHLLLSECSYPSLSGTKVYWDFVELPSQIMENWAESKDCLNLFAYHYQTGDKLPDEYIEKIKESRTFMEGYGTLRQLTFGILDINYFTTDPDTIDDIKSFEDRVTAETTVIPPLPGSMMSTAFSHIFSGGYSAGYYSYKWAEVLDADAFEYFKENGIFNKEIANLFRDHILSKGGTEHPAVLYAKFRGAEPSIEPLLRRSGFIK